MSKKNNTLLFIGAAAIIAMFLLLAKYRFDLMGDTKTIEFNGITYDAQSSQPFGAYKDSCGHECYANYRAVTFYIENDKLVYNSDIHGRAKFPMPELYTEIKPRIEIPHDFQKVTLDIDAEVKAANGKAYVVVGFTDGKNKIEVMSIADDNANIGEKQAQMYTVTVEHIDDRIVIHDLNSVVSKSIHYSDLNLDGTWEVYMAASAARRGGDPVSASIVLYDITIDGAAPPKPEPTPIFNGLVWVIAAMVVVVIGLGYVAFRMIKQISR